MTSQSKALKTTEELALQTLLHFQVGTGTLANILLFFCNISPMFTGSRLRSTQVIVTNLAMANAFLLLITAFPNKMMGFVPMSPPTTLKCKIEFFIRLVVRSTNMCSTCALSFHQFLTLAPGYWGRLKPRGRAPNVLSYSCYSCWLFSVLNNVYIPMKVSGPQSTGNDTNNNSKWVCSTSGFSVGMVILRFCHDAIFISVMVWSSVSMVLLLYRHHQRTQHILTSNQNHRGHAETRAAQTVLMLVVTFVSFYILDCICNFFHGSFVNSCLWLRRVNEVLTAGFPTISPFLMIFRDPKHPCSVLFNLEINTSLGEMTE
ncbi:vomeronasal type-1 receptor 4-like isoform X1 [Peromyscus maniculatus bairdii]|uniref:vomeronasal type-1 receptor 4-like isoform X1 n=1 Tax=Peromyscus maniculatus bairdii TaxID=230844 RepID=UPI00077DA2F6